MRTLLIDNYDSFTYNLYQYLAASNARPPRVIRNDELSWLEIESLEFDNIVISPGPGRPQRPADLGVVNDVLRHTRVPLLGVCLGHQAIAHFCGARVDLAVRPMHGRLDRVSHSGQDLFRGIPNPFEAVRYHSLAVTELPVDLEPLAWTSDGTLMALRHLARPWWGVQFHPESISTEYGARLLRNFRELTEEWKSGRMPRTFVNPAANWPPAMGSEETTVHAQCLDIHPDPESVFTHLFGDCETCFWLDSSLASEGRARFSYMGSGTGLDAELVTYRSRSQRIDVHQGSGTMARAQSIFDFLDERLVKRSITGPPLPFDFAGGYVGYFGYELKGELEGEHAHDADTPDALWIKVDRFIAFDHAEQQTWVVCLDRTPLQDENSAWMKQTVLWLAQPFSLAPDIPAGLSASLGPMEWQIGLRDYRQLVVECQRQILQGETYEVCLTNQLVGTGHIDSLEVYRTLRARNPAPYAAYIKAPGLAVMCASPELFLQVSTEGQVVSKPIKGTARRGATAAEDLQIASHLAGDEKTRSENLMIVDLLRNDLNRVCEVGSVHVPGLFQTETYATVHQLVSTISGRLRDGLSALDCVRSAFPGGSMTGAPKVRTMSILDRLEPTARGIYSGCIGYLSLNGAATLNIVIRTIVCAGDRVSIGTGGAIVAMSDPDDEVAEIVLKAQAQLAALGARTASATPAESDDA